MKILQKRCVMDYMDNPLQKTLIGFISINWLFFRLLYVAHVLFTFPV